MTATQLALLDPTTGVDAAAVVAPTPPPRLTLKRSCVDCLNAIRYFSGEATADLVAEHTGQQRSCASKRLGELERLVLITVHHEVLGHRGRFVKVYRLTEKAGLL